jgi:hypothetical protein
MAGRAFAFGMRIAGIDRNAELQQPAYLRDGRFLSLHPTMFVARPKG